MEKESRLEIRRFTTDYAVREDRIRISVETEDSQIYIMWLTRRLMIRMIPEFVKYLSEVVPTPTLGVEDRASAAPNTATRVELSDNAQRQRQINALGHIEHQNPVKPKTPDQVNCEELITSLKVQLGRNGVLVNFVADQASVQKMPFAQDSLRQWLGILHHQFRKAGWNDDVWPAWIMAKGWNQGPDALRLN
ncbi:hypothetical protein [Shimia abyssi]|uniref:Uncharacterized protein n=1 Tax=Shimia abyssi TaxID=1662395 RepID=A0A2P8F7C3_9RHOB|nr:hypothetical protein [Shimia abyssi]PSL17619.1 hypothetical protein CLV88_11666 [Shimia abyssi]